MAAVPLGANGRRIGLGLLALAVVVFLALAARRLPVYWTPRLASDSFLWTIALACAAAGLRFSLGRWAPAALIAVVTAYLAIGVGLMESAAVALLLIASRQLGAAALALIGARRRSEFEFSRPLIIGLALYVALFGAMAHGKGNSAALIFALLAAPVAVSVLVGRDARPWDSWRRALQENVEGLASLGYAPLVATVAVVGFVARFAFLPTVTYDEIAIHLHRWIELTDQHRFSFDVAANIWAVAPFIVDLMHAIVSLLAGDDARAALNLALLGLMLRQVWAAVARFELRGSDRLLIVALFASTPMIGWLLGTLQTELWVALLAAFMTRLLLQSPRSFDVGDAATMLAAAALCAAAKANAIPLGALFVAAAIAQYIFAGGPVEDVRLPPRRWPAALALLAVFTFLALYPYAFAWKQTGNPVFPLFNGVFCAPKYPCENIVDMRWRQGFNLWSFIQLFFRTKNFNESRDFVAGFQYLFLTPFACALIFRRLPRLTATLVLAPLLIFGAAMFWQIQYLRYLFPVAPIASIAFAALLPARSAPANPANVAARAAMLIFLALNLWFFAGVSWAFQDPLQWSFTTSGREAETERLSPDKALTARINQNAAAARVLYPNSAPTGGPLHGTAVLVNWYAPDTMRRFEALKNDPGIAAFLHDFRIDYVVLAPPDQQIPAELRLAEYLSRYGAPEFAVGQWTALRVSDHPIAYREIFHLDARASVVATQEPKTLAAVATGGATMARYRVDYRCPSNNGWFIAEVNWDAGAPYYKLLPCAVKTSTFADALPIPPGARRGDIYLTTRDAASATVDGLSLETN